MKRRIQLIWQLYPSYLVIILLSVTAISWYASQSLEHFFLERIKEDLIARGQLLTFQIRQHLSPLNQSEIDRLCKGLGGDMTTRITVILLDGRVVGDSDEIPSHMDNHGNRPEIMEAAKGNIGVFTRYSRTLQKNMMYVALPLKTDDRITAVVRTSIPLTSVEKEISSLQIKISIGGLIIALLASGVCLFISRKISKPIENMTEGAVRFAKGDLKHRLDQPNTLELSRLSKALNQMAAELENRINTVINQRNEYEAVLASMSEGVIAVDMEERILSTNQAASRMLSINAYQSKGRNILEAIRNRELHKFITEAISTGLTKEGDVIFHQQGEQIIHTQCVPLRNANDQRIGTLVVLNDVTQMRHLENVRSDFVANVSHEIKTPLTAIKGFVETLLSCDTQEPKERNKFLGIIQKHADRLGAIVEDLLSLARMEQKDNADEVIHLQSLPLKTVIDNAIQVIKPKAEEKQITVDAECDPTLEARIEPMLMEQACVNLLDNAVKYSPENSRVEIKAGVEEKEILVRVIDQGPGIPKKHQSRIFERFYRIDKARSRSLGGTGLGLSIVKHIAKTHGGRVSLDSTPGKGSVFVIHLPL